MNSSNYFFMVCLLVLTISCSKKGLHKNSLNIQKTTPINKSTSINSFTFPDDWVGKWCGDLNIYNNQGLTQTIYMELNIAENDSTGNYDWIMIYGQ